MMSRILMSLCLAGALLQSAVAAPLPLANSLDVEKESAIAFDPDGNRGLVVYVQNDYVYGRYVDGEGRPTSTPVFGIFPVLHPTRNRRYSKPSVTFKRGQNRFVIAAEETETRILNLPDGPLALTFPSGIAVTAFNADGMRAASRFLHTPIASASRNEKRPVVVADEMSDACCIAVAWEDETYARKLYVQRMDADLLPQGAIAEIAPASAERIANIGAVYELSRDRFTFVYDMVDAASRRWVATSSMSAFTGGSVRSRTVAERSGHGERIGDLPRGTPTVVHSEGLDAYLVAWRVGNGLRAAFLPPEITGTVSASFAIPTSAPCTTPPFCFFLSPTTSARPALVNAPGTRRVYVLAAMNPLLGDGPAVLGVYAIDSTLVTSVTPYLASISRASDGGALSAAAVWSPSARRIIAAWDSAGPTRDVYVGDLPL